MTRFGKKYGICPKEGVAINPATNKYRWRSSMVTLYLMVPIMLMISSVVTASENDNELEVECVWDSDLFITYNDFGIRVSESDISPNITITNNLEASIRITTVAVHTDWQKEGENYYSWVFDGGLTGKEVGSGESLNVKDVWMHLDPNRIGRHEYKVLVEYRIGSEQNPRSFITSDRSDLDIEFNKGRFIVSFLRGSDVIFLLIPVIILVFSLYKIQRYRDMANGSKEVNGKNQSNREGVQ